MAIRSKPQPRWKPTDNLPPSRTHRGETDTSFIYTAVGRALSQWEHLESVLTRLFQVLCEAPSFAACRAYGTVESSFARAGLLQAASEVFFATRNSDTENRDAIKLLLSAYREAQQYRNNIAHGIAVGFYLNENIHSGYFLCPTSCTTKKVTKIDPKEVYLLGASYWYNESDIDHYTRRFTELLTEAMRIIQEVNNLYRVLENSQLHP